MDHWVDAITQEIEALTETPIVLVGHSLAGMSLPRVAERIPEKLSHLVFVSCTVPPDGQTPMDMLPADIQAIARSQESRRQPTVLPEAAARSMFCGDMDEEQTRFVLDGLVPEAPGAIHEPSRLNGLTKGTPITWLRNLKDAVVPAEQQDFYIETMRAFAPVDVVDLDAGHNSFISQPEAFARILNRIHKAHE